MFSRRTSIVILIATFVVILTSLLLGAFGQFNYWEKRERLTETLKSELAVIADQLSVSLALPLRGGDRVQVDRIIMVTMKERAITGIAVRGAGMMEARGRDTGWAVVPVDVVLPRQNLLLEERSIVVAGESIGTVSVSATPRFLENDLQKTLRSSVMFILVLDLLLTISIYLLLRRWVLRPLILVEAYAASVSSGGLPPASVHGKRFRGEVESLRTSIERMVDLLQSRYQEVWRVIVLIFS